MAFIFNVILILFSKLVVQFTSIEVRNSKFALFVDLLTKNTFIMVVMSDPNTCKFTFQYIYVCYILMNILFIYIATVAVTLNIKNARQHFEELEIAAYKEPTEEIKFEDLKIDI